MSVSATKLCVHCRQEKQVTEFYHHASTKDRLTSWCKACTIKRARQSQGTLPYDEEPENRSRQGEEQTARICSDCGCTKTFAEFPNHPRTGIGKAPWCRECANNHGQSFEVLGEPITVVLVSSPQNENYPKHTNSAWVSKYVEQWSCPRCGTEDNLILVDSEGNSISTERITEMGLSELRSFVETCDVWCSSCISGGKWRRLNRLRRQGRARRVKEAVETADIWFRIRPFTYGFQTESVVVDANNTFKATKQDITEQIKQRVPCGICGESDPVTLDFHHVDSNTKISEIARMTRNNTDLAVLLEEIQKCAIVCSNCHRRIHAKKESTANLLPIRLVYAIS